MKFYSLPRGNCRREGGREGGTEGQREGRREGWREGGREGWKEIGKEGGRDGGRDRGGREDRGREGVWEGGRVEKVECILPMPNLRNTMISVSPHSLPEHTMP